jgi:hypothetical protein
MSAKMPESGILMADASISGCRAVSRELFDVSHHHASKEENK